MPTLRLINAVSVTRQKRLRGRLYVINVARKLFWVTLKKSTLAEVAFFNETWVQYQVRAVKQSVLISIHCEGQSLIDIQWRCNRKKVLKFHLVSELNCQCERSQRSLK